MTTNNVNEPWHQRDHGDKRDRRPEPRRGHHVVDDVVGIARRQARWTDDVVYEREREETDEQAAELAAPVDPGLRVYVSGPLR